MGTFFNRTLKNTFLTTGAIFHQKKRISVVLLLAGTIGCMSWSTHSGKPWKLKMQSLPGRVECEYYDQGGEGIAYHDTDSINNGSGQLNPANGDSLNEFRMKEGVDLSFTKARGIDDNPFNQIAPDLNRLYVGWTVPGEWINYTLQVKETSKYRLGLMYTANGDGTIALDIDGRPATGPLSIVSTHNAQDSIAWRQWHHWNRLDSLAEIEVSKGIHILTLRIVGNGNMNFDYLEFTKP